MPRPALLYGADGTIAVKATQTQADPDRMQALLLECFGALAGLISDEDLDSLGGPEELSKMLCAHIVDAVGAEALEERFEGLTVSSVPADSPQTPPLTINREQADDQEAGA